MAGGEEHGCGSKAHGLFHAPLLTEHPEVTSFMPNFKPMKCKFIHNRKGKTPTRWHSVIHLIRAKAQSFRQPLHLQLQDLKSMAKILLFSMALGSIYSCHIMALSSQCLMRSPSHRKMALPPVRMALKPSCPSRRLTHTPAPVGNPVQCPLVSPRKPTTS